MLRYALWESARPGHCMDQHLCMIGFFNKENPAPGIMLAGIKMESVRHAKNSFQYMYDEKTPETPTWAKSTSLRHFLDMPLLLLFSDEEGELSALSPHLNITLM